MYLKIYVVLLALLIYPVHTQPGVPLYDYVHRDDGMYSYTEVDSYTNDGVTSYVINMTSQQWFDDTWTDHPIWYHYLVIHIPDTVDTVYYNNAFLHVGLGDLDDEVPDASTIHVNETQVYAMRTGMVAASLKYVPNQPITFNGTLIDRREDTLIAYTWAQFLESGATENPEILARFPMCKAVVKAMDTISSVVADKTGGTVDVQKYMVAGESKRGWTTWLMPALDARVVAIAPTVLSCVNFMENGHHYWKSMGNWTFGLFDYWAEGITTWMDHPHGDTLLKHVDPYSYIELLTVPKLMVNAATDEIFMLDDYDYFYDELPGEKYLWFLENTDHDVASSPLIAEYWNMLETFYISVIKDHPRPSFNWTRATDLSTGSGYIMVTSEASVSDVVALMADTPDMVAPRRDFRKFMLAPDGGIVETGIYWYEYTATDWGQNTWRIDFDKPDSGYRAFYLKLTFPYPEENREFIFTTEVQILSFDPQREFPYDDCTLEACEGNLV